MIFALGIDNNRFYDIVLSSNDLEKSSTPLFSHDANRPP